jgi:glycosyltransferase involved in cell wall biosynthesis
MRIAAYVAGYTPEAGGGYTFESDVLEALIGAVGEQPTSGISLLCPQQHSARLAARLQGTALEVFPVAMGPIGRRLEVLMSEAAVLRSHWRRPSAIDRAARKAGADMIWFLGAGVHLTDFPYVTVVWDLQHRATPWFPEMSASGVWDRREVTHDWFLKRATAVIVGTEVGRLELERYYQLAPGRVVILPHPTPRFALEAGIAAAKHDELKHLGISRPYFLYPAQFWPHKNHVNLVMAFAQIVRERGIDADLVLVGSDKGNRAHVLAAAAAAGIAERIRCLGFLAREDLIRLYRNAIALAYVSWCGPENLPPLEAFALGCPVVAARIPGAAEQLGDAALLVDPGDPTAIAEGLARLYGNAGMRADLIAKGLARAQRWTARDYVQGAVAALQAHERILRCWRSSQ